MMKPLRDLADDGEVLGSERQRPAKSASQKQDKDNDDAGLRIIPLSAVPFRYLTMVLTVTPCECFGSCVKRET